MKVNWDEEIPNIWEILVNWDEEISNIWENKSHVPVTTNQCRAPELCMERVQTSIPHRSSVGLKFRCRSHSLPNILTSKKLGTSAVTSTHQLALRLKMQLVQRKCHGSAHRSSTRSFSSPCRLRKSCLTMSNFQH